MSWKEPPRQRSYACNPDQLVYLRERRGLTQKALAAAAGYSERLISKAEAGQPISADTVANLAEALTAPDEPIYPEDLVTDAVRLAKDYMAAIYSQGLGVIDAIAHFLDDDVVFRIAGDPAQIPFAGEHRGIPAARRAFEVFFSILEAPKGHNIEDHYRFLGQGNEVSIMGESWIHPIGAPLEKPIMIAQRLLFRRGKLVMLEDVYDTLAGAQALDRSGS